jgi:type VI secretion system secreted protein VgrG
MAAGLAPQGFPSVDRSGISLRQGWEAPSTESRGGRGHGAAAVWEIALMRRTRTSRRPDRLGCRPAMECLETRNLLSATTALGPAFDAMIGAAATRDAYGVDGAGLAAAVIDTGVNYRHDALGDGFGAGHKVLDGHDWGDNDPDPDASTWQHGTAVAGLIAASAPEDTGVAPGAGIVALKVFDSANNGGYDRIAQALQWVIDNHQRAGIGVVNLSLSDGNNYTRDGFPFDGGMASRLKGLIAQLKALNIPVVAASGNSFEGQQGMGYTAIMRDTISVTATDAADRVLPNAQRLGESIGGELATDLAAPGSDLKVPGEGESYSGAEGTSFAAPVVSGAIVLLQSIYRQRFGTLPTVDQLSDWLERGADTITDATTGITLPRLNIARSAALIPGAPSDPPAEEPPAEEPPVESPTPPPDPPATVDLYQDGIFVGQVVSGGADDPLRDAFGAFGLTGDFHTIRRWTAGQAGARAGRAEPAGNTARIPTSARRAKGDDGQVGEAAGALAAFRNRLSLLRAGRASTPRARFRARAGL